MNDPKSVKHRSSVDVFSLETGEDGWISVVRYQDYLNLEDNFDRVYDDWINAEGDLRESMSRVERLSNALDSLGVAIADAGITWTPEMRAAYEKANIR